MRVNPEIYNKVKMEVKAEEVHFQNIQKPLLKGIIAVSSLLSSLMTEEGEKEVSKEEIEVSLKDAISVLTIASHKIDLRRTASFKPFIKDDYASLCNEQTPVECVYYLVLNLGSLSKILQISTN